MSWWCEWRNMHIKEGPGGGYLLQVNGAQIQILFPSSPHRNTCLTVLSERGKGRLLWLSFSFWELALFSLSVHASLTRIEVCNLFPSCVNRRGAALCSPEEHKQLQAPLIPAGALNSFYAQQPTPIPKQGIICMCLPAALLISLAHLLCIHAAPGHIVLLLSDDTTLVMFLGVTCRGKPIFNAEKETRTNECVVFCALAKTQPTFLINSAAFCHINDVAIFSPSLPPISETTRTTTSSGNSGYHLPEVTVKITRRQCGWINVWQLVEL